MIKSYDEMPVGVYEKIMAALHEEGASDDDKMLAMLSALTGLSVDDLLDEPLDRFQEQSDAVSFVLVLPVPHKVRKEYVLGGVRYVPTLLKRKMTAGQFIDFNEYAKRDGADDLWAEMLSIILVPEGKTYGKDYDVAEVQEAIRDELCILDAIALRAFFLTSCANCAETIRRSLETAMRGMGAKRKTRKTMRRLLRSRTGALRSAGGGWRTLMRWLRLPDAAGMLSPRCP